MASRFVPAFGFALGLTLLAGGPAQAAQRSAVPGAGFPPCAPASESVVDETGGLDPVFCAEWNPEYPYNGIHCCGKTPKRRGARCFPERRKVNFCDEVTDEQKEYAKAVSSGKIDDALNVIADSIARRSQQSYCGVNNGFLAFGRAVVGTPLNRIVIRSPERCTNYATDGMAGLLEWLGRQIRQRYADPPYQGVKLVLGDISAPRGGCLAGPGGRKGHASHTSGQDADVSFLYVRPDHESLIQFHKDFNPEISWWMVKQIFKNPYACVRVVFLDRRLIAKLRKSARDDEDWGKYGRFLRHVRGHKNHFHVRVGDHPGAPGCGPDAHPELEEEEDSDADLPDPSPALPDLPTPEPG
jgi:murein endopeptidase